MTEIDKIRSVIRQFMESILLHGDSNTAMATISENVIGVGMGDQGTVVNRQELRSKLEALNGSAPVPCQVNYPNEEIRYHPPSFATASITYEVVTELDGNITRNHFIQTIAAKKEQGEWKICLVQAIPVELTPNGIESYPLSFADNALADLRSRITTETFNLMSDNFVGGVVGVYAEDGRFPLCFANDGIAHFLGYTPEEFNEVFRDDVSPIFYAEDYELAMKLTDDMIEQSVDVSVRLRLQKKDGSLMSVIDYARKTKDGEGRDVLIAVFTDISELVELQEKLEQQNATILSSIHYASKIQRDVLPSNKCFEEVFSDYSVFWKPRDIVGGDIYWLKNFEKGALLAVCDCTGHGIPGALLTMLVASVFDTSINKNNYQDTALLMMEADKRISDILNVNTVTQENLKDKITDINDGCDLAILFIAKDGSVKISSAGIPVFICDGSEVMQIKGQRLHIGDGSLNDKSKVVVTEINANPNNKFYIASDGMFDQIGGELSNPYGYRKFKEIILNNHMENQAVISDKIWNALELYRGTHRQRDDMELITFKP